MFKFALLALFLCVTLSWLYEPFAFNPSDEMIDKYRPSINMRPNTTIRDSIYPYETNYNRNATALNMPKAVYMNVHY